MPLDNSKLTPEMLKGFRDLPYEIKISIYDTKCAGRCEFARQLIKTEHDTLEFTNLSDAILCCGQVEGALLRVCTYPQDVQEVDGKIHYPSAIEIANNTCQFWNMDKLNIPQDTQFIEVGQELDAELSRQ